MNDKEAGRLAGEQAAWRKWFEGLKIKTTLKKPKYAARSKEYQRAWQNGNQMVVRMLQMQLLYDQYFGKPKKKKQFWTGLMNR